MRALLATFDPAKEPHRGSCGMCHNPAHGREARRRAQVVRRRECHADWRSVAFHVGAAHKKVAQQCQTCHVPHAARVDASDCAGCHEAVRKGGGKFQPPVPFDTTKALQQSTRLIEPGRARGRGGDPPIRATLPWGSGPRDP